MINTIEFSRRLESSGFKREQAEGIMTVNLELIELHLPSKFELKRLEEKMETKIERLEQRMDLKLEKLEQKMDKRFSDLNKVLMWAFGLFSSAQLAIILKLFF